MSEKQIKLTSSETLTCPLQKCNCVEMSRRGFDKQALGHSCDTDLSWTCPVHGVKLFKIKEWGEAV